MTSVITGQKAERDAEAFLRSENFRIVERNFRTRYGEIDLIVEKARLLVFVEVRMRNNPNFGSGADSVTTAKQRKIINSAEQFLKINGTRRWDDYRFDVISISNRSTACENHSGSDLDWIPGAFTLD